jgi:hypothetical protein
VKASTTCALEPQVGDLDWLKAAPQAHQALRSESAPWNLSSFSLYYSPPENSYRSSLSASSPLAIVNSMSQDHEVLPPDPESVPTDPLERAVWYGIDLTLLKENLRRTPTERLERHKQALAAAEAIRKAAREHRIRKTAAGSPRS